MKPPTTPPHIDLAYGTKTCVKCDEGYPPTSRFWNNDKSRPGGLAHLCKPCAQAHADKYATKPGWTSWTAMKARCTRQTAENYRRYGGRGIRITPTWLDYAAFIADNPGWFPGAEIDRIRGGRSWYRRGNTRWITGDMNLAVTADEVVDYGDGPVSVSALCREVGKASTTIKYRMSRIKENDPEASKLVAFLLAVEKPCAPYAPRPTKPGFKRRNEYHRATVRL